MNSLYWVGPRQSDILDIENLFSGSITIYGENTNNNIAYCKNNQDRFNHNVDNPNCHLFFVQQLEELCEKNEDVTFLFYNFEYAYQFDEHIKKHIIGLNDLDLINLLADKVKCRCMFCDTVNTIPFISLQGSECSYENFCKYFINSTEFVVQEISSSGGEGTFYVDKNTKLLNYQLTNNHKGYLISPYLRDSISLNIHIAIFEDEIVYFPPSVQIINQIEHQLLYHGADFICYDSLNEKTKGKLYSYSSKIGNVLKNKGYKGIIGIDFLAQDDYLYFMEINPRFQASSQLINKALHRTNKTSLQEIHLQAFNAPSPSSIASFKVCYSNYCYTTNSISYRRLQKMKEALEITDLQLDGYRIDDILPTSKNTYMCRCVFEQNICTINNNKLILHPNIFVEDVINYINTSQTHHEEFIKIALLNHGVTLSEHAFNLSRSYGTIKEAVFDAIDIHIFNHLAVNVPVKCKFVSISPFTIDVENNEFILYCDETKISKVKISFEPEILKNKKTSSGVSYDAIINLATDRIRINPAPICVYKKNHMSCKFCNLPEDNSTYNINDIKEVIDFCLKNVNFSHFLIGGGTYSLNGGWKIIREIASYIRSQSSKNVYLMSIPPQDKLTLDQLKSAGITEVAFNLEVFNRQMAKNIMPGKGQIEENIYMKSFEHAVKLWGRTGNVRSLIIYGFDAEETFLNGIEDLCRRGIQPIISIFRPLENTDFADLNPPPTLDIFSVYLKCKEIASKYALILGPDCPECQNNTLSYTK